MLHRLKLRHYAAAAILAFSAPLSWAQSPAELMMVVPKDLKWADGQSAPPGAKGALLASASEMFAEYRYAAGLVPLQKAAELGDPDARRTLGLMLLYGQSLYNTEVPTNREQGLRWLRMAASDGCEISRHMLVKFKP